jgi:hypothetical protein
VAEHWCEKAELWHSTARLKAAQIQWLMWRNAQLEAWIATLPSHIATNAPEPFLWISAIGTPAGVPENATCARVDAQSNRAEFDNFTVEIFANGTEDTKG